MSCVQLSEGSFQVVYSLGSWSRFSGVVTPQRGPRSYVDVTSKLSTCTFTTGPDAGSTRL